MDWSPPADQAELGRGASSASSSSPHRSTARGATDERALTKRYWRSLDQLAGDPSARGLPRAGVPRGGLRAARGRHAPHDARPARGLALARRPRGLPPAGREDRPLRQRARGDRARACRSATRRRCRSASAPTASSCDSHEGRPTKIEGNELHPSTARRVERLDPGRDPRAVRPRPLAAHPARPGDRRAGPTSSPPGASSRPEHLADGGAGLAVLAEPFSSPTLARLRRALRARFPHARWATWRAGERRERPPRHRARDGRALRLPVHHFDRARVVLALDCGLPARPRPRACASARLRRRPGACAAPGDEMSRLWAVEGVLSLTGANADHRLRLPSAASQRSCALRRRSSAARLIRRGRRGSATGRRRPALARRAGPRSPRAPRRGTRRRRPAPAARRPRCRPRD